MKSEHRPKKGPQTASANQKWVPRRPKWHQERPKIAPRRDEEGSKTIPDRKSNKEPHQDDHMTGLGPQGRGGTPSSVSPQGNHLAPKNGTKKEPKAIQNRSENRESTKTRSKTIKELSWIDLGRFGGAMWEPQNPKSMGKHNSL